MSTYETLRDRALNQCGLGTNAEAQVVAQAALEEAMKFVAFKVRIPSLILSATATAPASPTLEANAITLSTGGFNITSTYQCVDRLYVQKDSTIAGAGTPYDYLEYHYFLDLKSAPGAVRTGIDSRTSDERPKLSFTITPSGKLWSENIVEDNVLTLVYRTPPAAYSGSSTPEILPLFDWILVKGACLALQYWEREPEEIATLWDLFQKFLTADCGQYDEFLSGQRVRSHLNIHRSYRSR